MADSTPPSAADRADRWRGMAKQLAAEVLIKCGSNAQLAIDAALTTVQNCKNLMFNHGDSILRQQKLSGWALMCAQPLLDWLQAGFAECHCSPFGRLRMLNLTGSGSLAEKLTGMQDGPTLQATSDSDLMIELGPVHWVMACPGQPTTVQDQSRLNTDTNSGPGTAGAPNDDSSAPRLLIAETANPGFVRVLQERSENCPHEELLPFKSEKVRQLIDALYRITSPERQQSTAGPSTANVVSESEPDVLSPSRILEHDHLACLYVPGWWPSDEFFKRPRKNDWPPKAMRDDIRQFGVHLVPTGAKGSPTEDSEWRLSFSRSELVVTSDLTEVQANSLVAFKTCKTSMGQEGKVIKSYFAKTALLWLRQELPVDVWTGAVEGAERIINFLEKAIKAGRLPAFFCADINLLQMTNRNERKAMLRALGNMKKHMAQLLLMNAVIGAHLGLMLRREILQVSERQLRVYLARSSVVTGVEVSGEDRSEMPSKRRRRLAALVHCATAEEVLAMMSNERPLYIQQSALFHAFTVAPADVQVKMRLSSSGGGGFVWDAAPLMELLTEEDLVKLLRDPDAVRTWLRRQHQLPETERLAGLPADLNSGRGRADLLLNVPLLTRALRETGCSPSPGIDDHTLPTGLVPFEEFRDVVLHSGGIWASGVCAHSLTPGMDEQQASDAACRFLMELEQHVTDPKTRVEYNRLGTLLQDPWHLGQFMLRSYR